MGRVLVSAPLAGDEGARLSAEHEVTVGPGPAGLGKAALLGQIGPYEGLIALLTDRIDDELLRAAPRLRVVANHAVGLDNVDLAACRARGVIVTHTPGVLADATADLTMALLLAVSRRVVEADRGARAGTWPGWAPTFLLGKRVTGATLGLVGLGATGQAVARRARGFGMRLLYAAPRPRPADLEAELGVRHVSLDELVTESDVVSLHCPLNDGTRRLFDGPRIGRMKAGSILLNTARGGCVDADAVADAVASGHLFGAGLDVFEDAPRIPARLVTEGRVVLTTHLGSADEPTRAAMGRLCVDAILAVFAGEEPRCRVA